MKILSIPVFCALFFGACSKDASLQTKDGGRAKADESIISPDRKPAVGDEVLYMYDEYHFYEARLSAVEGNKAKLWRDDTNYERDLSDVYLIPKTGEKATIKEGDYVAARYGKLPTWPTAKVVNVSSDKITVKRIISGNVEELSPENVLAVSPNAASKIREAASKKGI